MAQDLGSGMKDVRDPGTGGLGDEHRDFGPQTLKDRLWNRRFDPLTVFESVTVNGVQNDPVRLLLIFAKSTEGAGEVSTHSRDRGNDNDQT